jgi:molecular chaperone GrpE
MKIKDVFFKIKTVILRCVKIIFKLLQSLWNGVTSLAELFWNHLKKFWLWFVPRISRLLRIEYPQAIYVPFPPGDWRQEILRDFADWLAEVETPPSHPLDLSHDLLEVLTELAALRQEVKRQNREQSKFADGLTRVEESYQEMVSQINTKMEVLDTLSRKIRQDTEKSVFLFFADLRDTLQRGLNEVETSSQKKKFLWKPPPGLDQFEDGYEMALARFQGYEMALDHFKEGYGMALDRFDRILSHLGIEKVLTCGRPFDSRVMVAIGTRLVSGTETGTVVEESVSGYVRGDEVIRPAQVVVVADEHPLDQTESTS